MQLIGVPSVKYKFNFMIIISQVGHIRDI